MKYKEEVKDLFSVSEDYYFAHCISADFGMGKGIVVEFNKRFDMKHILQRKYPEYAKHFMDCKISGDCILEGRVLNLITKERYFHKPTLAAMKATLQKMKEICERESIYKIAMPTIGAGLDRLKWEDVATQIKNVFEDTEIEILSNYMVINYLDSNYIRVPLMLKQTLSSKDFNAFSPANHLGKVMEVREKYRKDNETLLSRYRWIKRED